MYRLTRSLSSGQIKKQKRLFQDLRNEILVFLFAASGKLRWVAAQAIPPYLDGHFVWY